MRESSVETYLRDSVRQAGGISVKLNPVGMVGIPDRLVLLPGGIVVFVECKKPRGSRIARLQVWWKDELERLGFRHWYVFTREDVDRMMEELA